MAIFKVPRATTAERAQLVLEKSELVFDTDLDALYGGDGNTQGGFKIGGEGQIPQHEVVTLTSTHITQKYIQLLSIPSSPTATQLIPVGGIQQRYAIDYVIAGNILSWDTLGLDNFLEVGDVLIINYYIGE